MMERQKNGLTKKNGILEQWNTGKVELTQQVHKNFLKYCLGRLQAKGKADFFDGYGTSPPVPFAPPTLTLPLRGHKR